MNQIRLNRLLARHGICSRRKADEFIQQGRVAIDGIVCREVGTEVNPNAERITFDGKPLEIEPKRDYLLFNKPVGVVTTKNDPQGRQTVMDFLPKQYHQSGVFPVGRLDADSEGLLLLTNDGDWAQILLHPSHQMWKEYIVTTDTPLNSAMRKRLEQGMTISGKKTLPARIQAHNNTIEAFRMQIREGQNRQIRRMCQKVNLNVLSLQRVAMGPIQLGDLPSGKWRFLTEKEIQTVFGCQTK